VRIPTDVLFQELDGEMILLSLETEEYYELNESGTKILLLLAGAASIQTAYDALLKEYVVQPDTLREDLLTLVDELVSHGLVEVSTP